MPAMDIRKHLFRMTRAPCSYRRLNPQFDFGCFHLYSASTQ
jgi:hypothetical protein